MSNSIGPVDLVGWGPFPIPGERRRLRVREKERMQEIERSLYSDGSPSEGHGAGADSETSGGSSRLPTKGDQSSRKNEDSSASAERDVSGSEQQVVEAAAWRQERLASVREIVAREEFRSTAEHNESQALYISPAEALVDAESFLEQFHAETTPAMTFDFRLREIQAEIDQTGTYVHTEEELIFGARVAWRNSAGCIGRLYWNSLKVRDRRGVHLPNEISSECEQHVLESARDGRVRATLTVFASSGTGGGASRIANNMLPGYAGWSLPDGRVVGDEQNISLTREAYSLGWRPEVDSEFVALPLIIRSTIGEDEAFELRGAELPEVTIRHPEYSWFEALGIKWSSLFSIANQPLHIGGVVYPNAPLTAWNLGTDIAKRGLGRHSEEDILTEIAKLARISGDGGPSTRRFGREHALVELSRAIAYSYDSDGVTLADSTTETRRFLTHVAREDGAGRHCPVDVTRIGRGLIFADEVLDIASNVENISVDGPRFLDSSWSPTSLQNSSDASARGEMKRSRPRVAGQRSPSS